MNNLQRYFFSFFFISVLITGCSSRRNTASSVMTRENLLRFQQENPIILDVYEPSSDRAQLRQYLEFLAEYSADYPAELDPYINRGKIFLILGQPKDALYSVKQGLKHDRSNAALLLLEAQSYRAFGKDKKAVRPLRKAYRSVNNPEEKKQITFELARIYLRLNQFDRAHPITTEYIDYNPNDPEGHKIRGELYQAERLYTAAIAPYKKALETAQNTASPSFDFLDTYIRLGTLYAHNQNYEESIIFLEKALALDPDNPVIHNNLCSTYFFSGNRDKTVEHYHILRKLDKIRADSIKTLIYNWI